MEDVEPYQSLTAKVQRLQSENPDSDSTHLPLIREVQSMINERSRQRFTSTLTFMNLMRRTRPPPPQSIAELESHPLLRRSRYKMQADDEDNPARTKERVPARPPLPFLAAPVTARHLRAKLTEEVNRATLLLSSRRSHSKVKEEFLAIEDNNNNAGAKRPFAPHPPHSLLTERPNGEKNSQNSHGTPKRLRDGSPTQPASSRSVAFVTQSEDVQRQSGQPTPRRRMTLMGKERMELPIALTSALSRSPEEFRKLRNEDRHSQFYRRGTCEQWVPSKPEWQTAQEARDFLRSLTMRDSDFNSSATREIDRVCSAQSHFRAEKSRQLNELLDSSSLANAPWYLVMSVLSSKKKASTRQQDDAERLDVFYDHVRGLRALVPKLFFHADEEAAALAFLQDVTKAVRDCDGRQSLAEFADAANKNFSPETFLLDNVMQFLSLTAPMFGVVQNEFRRFVSSVLQRFESRQRDYVLGFRPVDRGLGKEVSQEVSFRFMLHEVQCSSLSKANQARPELFVHMQCESQQFTTNIHQSLQAVWSEDFDIHLYDETSPMEVRLFCAEEVIGEAVLRISHFQSKKRQWISLLSPAADMVAQARLLVSVDMH